MRHNKHHASLGVTIGHRRAMLSNLGAALIRHGRIETTFAKAKALRPWIEKIITKAKKAGAIPRIEKNGKQLVAPAALHLRRLAMSKLRDEDMITKLFNETYKEFEKRPGGYTRIYKLGPRIGDAAHMALIEFVKADDPGHEKRKRTSKPKAKKAAKPAAEAPAAAPESGEAKA